MHDVWVCAWRELMRRKGRMLVNVFGYLLAVASMGVLLTVLFSAKDAQSRVLSSTGTHFIGFSPLCDQGCYNPAIDPVHEGLVANGVPTKFIDSHYVAKIRKLSTVKDASPYLLFRFFDPKSKESFTVGGFDPAHDTVVATTCCAASDIVDGQFLAPDDHGQVLLDEAYARRTRLKAGNTVVIAGTRFLICGVVNPGVRPARADIYMHFDEARRVINTRLTQPLTDRDINVVLVEVRSSRVQREAMQAVRALIPDAVISSYACWNPAARVIGMSEGAAWVLAAVLACVVMGIAVKSQLASVIERRHDIGILRAIGWPDHRITAQLLLESVLQAAMGGILGCVATLLIVLLIPLPRLLGAASVAISPLVLGAAFLLALFGGMLAGVIPALHAVRQQPADSLRQL